MGILEDYIGEGLTAKPVEAKRGGILEQYIDDAPTKKISSEPKPPISGISKEASDELNQTRLETKGGENPRPGIGSVPVKAGASVYEAAKAGVLEAGQGLGETLSGKPATGLGNVGMGLMSLVGSPFEGIGSVASDLTGNKEIGDRAKLAVPILPAANTAKYFMRMPTSTNLNPLVNPVSKIAKSKAFKDLVDGITSGGRDNQALVDTVNAMKADPRIGPADISPAVLGATQNLFVKEGNATKNYLHSTSKDRLGKLGDDVSAAFDEASGLPVNAVNKLKELSSAAEKVGTEKINPAIANAKPVDISEAITHIDEILKPGVMQKITGESTLPFPRVKQALKQVKDMIASESERLTGAKQLHDFQWKLRAEAQARINSADGEQRQLGHALMEVRNKVVDAIDKASPKIDGKGTYKPALNDFRTEKEIGEAFHDAYNGVLTNSKKLENRPEFTKEWFDGLSKHEKEAAIEGIRTRIDTEMGVSGNPSLAGTNLGKSDFNQKKMEAILGKEETENLLRKLENTRRIKNTDQKIIEGSQTAARLSLDDATKLSKDMPKPEPNAINKYALPLATIGAEAMTGQTGMAGLAMAGLGVGSKIVSKGKAKVIDLLEKEHNLQLAKYALPVQGPDRDALIKALEAQIPGPKQSIMTRGANSLSRIVGP